jgi:hypothetical protein
MSSQSEIISTKLFTGDHARRAAAGCSRSTPQVPMSRIGAARVVQPVCDQRAELQGIALFDQHGEASCGLDPPLDGDYLFSCGPIKNVVCLQPGSIVIRVGHLFPTAFLHSQIPLRHAPSAHDPAHSPVDASPRPDRPSPPLVAFLSPRRCAVTWTTY